MPFSFNPGQEQTSLPPAATMAPPSSNNGVPTLNVPVAPTISLTPVAEPISPFAYKNRSKSKFGVYFQSAIFLIFAVSLFSSLGIFAYQVVLNAQIASKQTELDEVQNGFAKLPVEEMQRLASRISLINKIVNERGSVITALTVLEESIDNSVVYTKFTLSRSKKNNYYDISFTGETNSYSSLYQQVEILKSKLFSGVFPKISITGIGPLDKKGIASFKVDASIAIAGVDPDGFTVINKGKNNNSAEATSTTQTQQVETSATTTDSLAPQQ